MALALFRCGCVLKLLVEERIICFKRHDQAYIDVEVRRTSLGMAGEGDDGGLTTKTSIPFLQVVSS